jgi:tRNA(Ile)-lysidine synthase
MLNTVKTFVDKHHMIQKKDKILLAVSGGPDSMALLHIMEVLRKTGD